MIMYYYIYTKKKRIFYIFSAYNIKEEKLPGVTTPKSTCVV